MKPEVLKGHLALILLASLESGPAHGYAVLRELRRRSGGTLDLPEGTLYPALHRLEASRCLRSRWEERAGRRRRVYAVTARGRRVLARERAEWSRFARAVRAVVGGPA